MGRFIRSILFDALFYIASFVIMVIFLPLMVLPQGAIFWAGRVWVRVAMGLLKAIVGLSWRAEGAENLPDGPCIVACKHESAWETLVFHLLLNRPAIALKRELTWIPVINLYFKRMGMVAIDRGAGASALKSLIQGARRVIAQNRPLVIFPEGTRSMPGKPGHYQAGVAALYRDLNVPVIPVALNSGLFWGRRSLIKRPGVITWQFLPPIEPGLSRAEFMETLVERIESACVKLNDRVTAMNKGKEKPWGRWAIQGALAAFILGMGFDYGKHLVLKRVLEGEIAGSQGLLSFQSLSVSPWPLLQSHLVLKNFHVNLSGTPLAVETVSIRQGWPDWGLAHIQATDGTSDGTVGVQEAQGILDITDLETRVKVSRLILKGIQVRLPLLAFSGKEASFDFLYEMGLQHLSLQVEAPEMSFANGVTFGIKGEGMIETKAPVQGKMDVKIRNIDKMMKELVAAGVVDASQAGFVTAGSDFLGNIGLHDITLPLKIEDGDVSLGPIPLFRVGKGEGR